MDEVMAGDEDAAFELEELAHDDPDAVAPHLVRLLDAEVYVPESVFRAAGADVQREAVARVDAGDDDWDAYVAVLTMTRGPVVEEALERWLRRPPPGVTAEEFRDVVRHGGRDFDADGRVRPIRAATAWRLELGEGTARAEESCPWCGCPLWNVLDLDADWVARALAHTSWRGRLRIVTCFWCNHFTDTYARVAPDGGASWSPHTVRPGHLTDPTPEGPPPAVRLVPAAERSGLALAGEGAGESTLGALPGWLQDPSYPACPACGDLMDYVGAVALADVDPGGVGVTYLFLHAPCELAAAVKHVS